MSQAWHGCMHRDELEEVPCLDTQPPSVQAYHSMMLRIVQHHLSLLASSKRASDGADESRSGSGKKKGRK